MAQPNAVDGTNAVSNGDFEQAGDGGLAHWVISGELPRRRSAVSGDVELHLPQRPVRDRRVLDRGAAGGIGLRLG